jgi:DNA helicase-2/ATP-dependent DNA helicase PcrA
MNLEEKEYPPRKIQTYISTAKNSLLTPSQYEQYVDSHFKEVVRDVYHKYQKKLQENNALDFDDILIKTHSILQKPEILSLYQEKYKYIMVDEYQDTNITQYEIIKMLASKYRNLAVVGDDWQSIYSWRGADMRNILNFQKDYPESLVIKLEQNYRSTQNIINAANELIKNNTNALKKTLWTQNDT